MSRPVRRRGHVSVPYSFLVDFVFHYVSPFRSFIPLPTLSVSSYTTRECACWWDSGVFTIKIIIFSYHCLTCTKISVSTLPYQNQKEVSFIISSKYPHSHQSVIGDGDNVHGNGIDMTVTASIGWFWLRGWLIHKVVICTRIALSWRDTNWDSKSL